jgi:hypothetical protein
MAMPKHIAAKIAATTTVICAESFKCSLYGRSRLTIKVSGAPSPTLRRRSCDPARPLDRRVRPHTWCENHSSGLDSYTFYPAGSATLYGNSGLTAMESTGNKGNEFFVGLAINRGGLELREPSAVFGLFQRAQPRVGFDSHLNKYGPGCHRLEALQFLKRRRSRR